MGSIDSILNSCTMRYYEINFYNFGENNPRSDYDKAFTFYCKTDKLIWGKEQMIEHLRENFPVTDRYNCDTMNCIAEEHYPYLSSFVEIPGDEFEFSCGVSA